MREPGEIYCQIAEELLVVRQRTDPGHGEPLGNNPLICGRLTPTALLNQDFPARDEGTPYAALVVAEAMPTRILVFSSTPEESRPLAVREVALALMDNFILRDERP